MNSHSLVAVVHFFIFNMVYDVYKLTHTYNRAMRGGECVATTRHAHVDDLPHIDITHSTHPYTLVCIEPFQVVEIIYRPPSHPYIAPTHPPSYAYNPHRWWRLYIARKPCFACEPSLGVPRPCLAMRRLCCLFRSARMESDVPAGRGTPQSASGTSSQTPPSLLVKVGWHLHFTGRLVLTNTPQFTGKGRLVLTNRPQLLVKVGRYSQTLPFLVKGG